MSDCPKMKNAVYHAPGLWSHTHFTVYRASERPVRWRVTLDPDNVFYPTMCDAMAKLNGLSHEAIVKK